jgi:4-hydroxy-3-polyprenylbenzoate decarboxylase
MAARPVPEDLSAFLAAIESAGELRRIRAEVDAELEITEIVHRVLETGGGPALLFERVRGSPYPLAINVFSSARRLEIAFGRPPSEIGAEILGFLERINPPSLKALFQSRSFLWRAAQMRVRRTGSAPSQEVVEEPDLGALPILKCWPDDGGRFITYPLVITTAKRGRQRNLGLYRMQVHGPAETGMHWQIQKGGGFHHHAAEKDGRDLEVAVAIGADPALLFAAMAPLPEGVDEVAFSGLLRGRPARMAPARSIGLEVPASAEFVLEGVVPAGVRRLEGPFGDHYGHYSHAAEFPVFRIRKLTRRRRPIYLAAVVGRPPQEDMWLGNAAQEIFSPILRVLKPEIRDLWSFYEGGFHTLLAVSMESRYQKEGMKTALGLLGEGQLSLTKWIVVVDAATSPRDFRAVLRAIRDRFDPRRDFLLLPGTSMDTLDFSSFRMNLGSKMVIDATGDLGPAPPAAPPRADPGLFAAIGGIRAHRVLEDCLLAVQLERAANHRARDLIADLVRRPTLAGFKLIVALSDDVALDNDVDLLWGFLTRFEPARDCVFAHAALHGACPVYGGPLGIDATFKEGYPAPLLMDPAVVERVERRWGEFFPKGM